MVRTTVILFALCLAVAMKAPGQDNHPGSHHGRPPHSETNFFNVTVPSDAYDLIPVRPEDRSITISVLPYQDMEASVRYGTASGNCTNQTAPRQLKAFVPCEFVLSSLQPGCNYLYQFRWRPPGATQCMTSPEQRFCTARPPGSDFTFTLTADSHLDEHTSPGVYQQTLANIHANHPDFHLDLGNLFMTDKHATRAEAARQYLAQRYYLSQIGSPTLLALGVHDGENSRYDDGSPDNLAAWSNRLRKEYFPDPYPDGFYTGNSDKTPSGLLEDYFAWTWGDALFVVLDPYRYSLRNRGPAADGWSWSLGREQYDWLARTLAASSAKYKFIFIHNLLAGDQSSRGGVEIAGFNEWGGRNLDATEGFSRQRPGWPMPVHQLLLKNHVNAVFRAHDNFYARQELDGILYLMVPQPSFAGNDRIRDLQNYGYKQGIFLGNSGHVRVHVSPGTVTVEYIKSSSNQYVADRFVLGHQSVPTTVQTIQN